MGVVAGAGGFITMVHFVSINGNIGSGKSTLLKEIEIEYSKRRCKDTDRVPVMIVPEPIEEWCRPVLDQQQCSMLKAFYGDPKLNAFSFQMYVLYTRFRQIFEIMSSIEDDNTLVIVERGPWVDLELMGLPIRDSGALSEMQWVIYEYWHNMMLSFLPPLSAVVYLQIEPQVCIDRIETRGRRDEKGGIDIDYLKRVHDAHESYVCNCPHPKTIIKSLDSKQTEAAKKVIDWIEAIGL